MIDELIAGGASTAARDRDGRTPLAIAVRTAHDAAAASLRRAGAIDAEVDDVDHALAACLTGKLARVAVALRRSDHQHVAWVIRRGHLAALPSLLALGLDPNVPDDDGETPLHLAAAARAVDAVDALLAAGVAVDALDYDGTTALAIATRLGGRAVIARLKRAGARSVEIADLDELFESAADAVVAGDLVGLTALLDREPRLVHARSLRSHRATLLHYTGANGIELERQRSPSNAPAIATLLLARGADSEALALTYGGGPAQTTLYLAATSSWPEQAGVMAPLLAVLLAGGAHVNDDDREQLEMYQPSALAALADRGLSIDLWLATALGRIGDARRFVRADGSLAPGAKLGSQTRASDATIRDRALLAAATFGQATIAELLIDAGARLDAIDVEAFTPLHRAAFHDQLDVARVLVARGAPLSATNAYGATPLSTLRWAINKPRSRPNADALMALLDRASRTDGLDRMSNELRDQDYEEIGMGRDDVRALQAWALERTGYVFDKSARGGSGSFVKTRDGEIALLTASHVVISAILSGQLTVGAFNAGTAAFRPPSCIILSSKCDAALIVPDKLDVSVYLDVDDWRPVEQDVNPRDRLLAAGLPGEWKGHRDLERRVVKGARVMLLWTEVTDVRSKEIEMVARWNLPSTLGGMSGGPLFSFDRRLLGVHQAEKRDDATNALQSLISTRRHLWSDLFDPNDDIEWPADLEIQPFRWESRGYYALTNEPVMVGLEGLFGTSRSNPSHPRGAFGLVQKMRFLNSEESRRYTMNVWSRFVIDSADDPRARMEAVRLHGRELLLDLDIIIDPSP